MRFVRFRDLSVLILPVQRLLPLSLFLPLLLLLFFQLLLPVLFLLPVFLPENQEVHPVSYGFHPVFPVRVLVIFLLIGYVTFHQQDLHSPVPERWKLRSLRHLLIVLPLQNIVYIDRLILYHLKYHIPSNIHLTVRLRHHNPRRS